jgi:hypothetical protein
MTNPHHGHDQCVIDDLVEDPIIPLPNPIFVIPTQSLGPYRPRILGERGDSIDDPSTILQWDTLDLLRG